MRLRLFAGGTAYVLTQLFTGANVPFTPTAKAAA